MTRPLWLCVLCLLLETGCECNREERIPDAGPTGLGVGDACAGDSQCRATLLCTGGTCQPAGLGVEGSACALTGDCSDGLYCDVGRMCALAGDGADGADCESTAECMPGLVCSLEGLGFRCRAAGTGDLGDVCAVDLDCLAGLRCIVGMAGARACQSPAPFVGDGGTGVEPPPTLPIWTGETCAEDEGDGPPISFFRVPRGDGTDGDFYRLPFPNDVRRTATGISLEGHPSVGDTLAVDILGQIIDAAEEDLDGFATNPVVFFRFSQPVAGVGQEHVMFVDISPSSPEYGRQFGAGWTWTYGRFTPYLCPNWMALTPGGPLLPSTTYAAILMRGVRTPMDQGDEEIGRDAELDTMLAATAPASEPLASAHAAYAPLRAWIADQAVVTEDMILNAAVFTTQDPRPMVPGMRAEIEAAAAPAITDLTVCDDGVVSPCDDGDQRVCGATSAAYWEVHARIALPQFQQGTPPYETPADGGAIGTLAGGAPTIARTEPVCMVMTIPRVTTPPAGGFPLLLFAHGTGGAFTAPVSGGIAAVAAGAPGAITIGIDMPLHGSRRGASTRDPERLVFNIANPRAARDNFLQGAADLMSLVHWAQSYVLAAADSPTGFDVSFDASRVVLLAHSQGATHAQLMVPYEPGISAVLLSGAGGNLTQSLLTKTEPVNIAGLLPLALLDVDRGTGMLPAGASHPALALIQMFYERVDPVNYGRHLWRQPIAGVAGRHVFMTYGLGDHFSTEPTMQAYARAASLTHVEPELVDIGLTLVPPPITGNVMVGAAPFTVGMRQYMPNAGDDGHFVAFQTTEGRTDAERFITQALSGAAPSIGQ